MLRVAVRRTAGGKAVVVVVEDLRHAGDVDGRVTRAIATTVEIRLGGAEGRLYSRRHVRATLDVQQRRDVLVRQDDVLAAFRRRVEQIDDRLAAVKLGVRRQGARRPRARVI